MSRRTFPLERAQKLRDAGLSFTAIANAVGYSPSVVRRHLVPKAREQQRRYQADYHAKRGVLKCLTCDKIVAKGGYCRSCATRAANLRRGGHVVQTNYCVPGTKNPVTTERFVEALKIGLRLNGHNPDEEGWYGWLSTATGLDSRRLRKYFNGVSDEPCNYVMFDTADRALCRLGLVHLWRAEPEEGGFADLYTMTDAWGALVEEAYEDDEAWEKDHYMEEAA